MKTIHHNKEVVINIIIILTNIPIRLCINQVILTFEIRWVYLFKRRDQEPVGFCYKMNILS